ncbi:sucrase ferredoxin [Blastococcus sp. CCUG 61487]|uniref:sucrase ferredoxin n=1 Tax=Blastococcus sp. CCUG 61487 TaxID=1840703 RepID=UPI0010BFB70A|nr:sucrase ferredoxin [Blastococcus sp. CCUG 61487]TKJ33362.1 sucrase ferredoxin [Blastococcus sp. CCUG 61487]
MTVGEPDDFCRTDLPALPTGRLDPARCSVQALERGDSGMATASPVQRWLLVEQPGPWGRDALLQSRFDARIAPLLAERARREGVRVLLVRRPGARLADSGQRWGYADGRPGREGLWWSARASDADLLDVPWDGSVGTRSDRPTYLVCTHGGHDACCALRGRPLARAMPATDVWECSHLGGDRFAANVVVLPHGFYYGQVPGDGGLMVAAHERGQVALAWLRGRAGLPAHVQAAQHGAREELGRLGIDDLHPVSASRVPEPAPDVERWAVSLADGDHTVEVVVESRPSPEPVRLTCQAERPGRVRTWHWLSVTRRPTG